ncbi:MAG TPA: FAD-dependent monooxygenase [Actinocrinis sp.]|nr:FAD-dependent monooxygenase [Actinocrinis sp.]
MTNHRSSLFGIGGSLNVGLLDALNLGWKPAADLRGRAPAGLVGTYHAERHAAGERALMSARAQRLLGGPGPEAEAARTLLGELAGYPEPLRHLGELLQTSDVRYTTGPAGHQTHRLQGAPAPDIRVQTPDGHTRTAELMRPGLPVLLDLGGPVRGLTPAAVAAPWHGTGHGPRRPPDRRTARRERHADPAGRIRSLGNGSGRDR